MMEGITPSAGAATRKRQQDLPNGGSAPGRDLGGETRRQDRPGGGERRRQVHPDASYRRARRAHQRPGGSAGRARIAYLQQEFDVDLERTVRQELFQAFGEAAEVMNQQKQVEEAMGSERAAEDPDHLDQLIQELGKLQIRFEALHGYELDARIDKLLPTIGFTPEGAELQVKDYSGGWQMRIALGKSCCRNRIFCCSTNPPTI